MTEERAARLKLYKEHCIVAEQKLFDAIQALSAKENMTTDDAKALAAVTAAMVSLQQFRY